MTEQRRVQDAGDWYLTSQLQIDRTVLGYRYRAILPYFRGRCCLELGPADGEMTSQLVATFEDVTVVDAVPQLLRTIPDDPRLTKVESLFEHFHPGRQFDTVIADHVLEHVDDPRALLERIRKWLAPNGALIVGVPNANSIHRLAAVKMGLLKSPTQLNERDVALGHRRVYTLTALESEITAAGFERQHVRGVLLKPLSYAQMELSWTPQMIDAFVALGADFPEIAAEIFVVCT